MRPLTHVQTTRVPVMVLEVDPNSENRIGTLPIRRRWIVPVRIVFVIAPAGRPYGDVAITKVLRCFTEQIANQGHHCGIGNEFPDPWGREHVSGR